MFETCSLCALLDSTRHSDHGNKHKQCVIVWNLYTKVLWNDIETTFQNQLNHNTCVDPFPCILYIVLSSQNAEDKSILSSG